MNQRPEITKRSRYGFAETVERLVNAAPTYKFSVLATHPVSQTLEEKGFPRAAVTVIEVCNAKFASQALNNDIRVALMMPCPIAVVQTDQGVDIHAMDTRILSQMYEGADMPALGQAMYEATLDLLAEVCD